jgi:hypothetical protein
MPSLEYIVRPYQARDPQGRVIIPSTPIGTHQQATITWGGKATLPPVQSQPGNGFSCCSEQTKEETDQKYDTVTVANEGTGADAGQSITFRRAKSFSYEKREQSKCASDWDQFSGIGMEISDALSSFAADIASSETLQGEQADQTCRGTMSLHNQPGA